MTRPCCTPLSPPRTIILWQSGILIGFIALLSACGSVDYDLREYASFTPEEKKSDLAVIHFHYGDTGETYDAEVRRVRGGYALQSALYTDPDGDEAHLTASRTREHKYFIGVTGRFSF